MLITIITIVLYFDAYLTACAVLSFISHILWYGIVDCLKKSASIHGLKLKREFKVCEDCAVAKARQRNVNEDCKGGSQVLGERVYLDISSIKVESYGRSCFWA
jgi:hypothetical protein